MVEKKFSNSFYVSSLWNFTTVRILLAASLIFFFHNANAQSYLTAFKIGTTGYDEGRGIVLDASGNIYVAGYFSGTVDFDPGAGTANLLSAGLYDIYVAKYNSSGIYQWAFRIGNTSKDIGFGIEIDASANIYISGYFQGTADFDPGAGTANLTSGGVEDIFIAKYNSSGIYQWAYSIGNTGIDQSLNISLDGSSNILITGTFSGTVDFDPGAGTSNLSSAGLDDIFVAKYNSSGIYQWAFKIGSISSDIGYAIDVDVSGNVYVTGDFQGTADFDPGVGIINLTSAGVEDIFAAKYNSSGTYQWAINIGSTSRDIGNGITADSTGNVYITGAFQGTADFDPAAGIANLTSAGVEDIFLAKYNSSGAYQWALRSGGTGIDNGIEIAFDPTGSGDIYTTGYFAATSDFDPGAGTANLTSSGTQDIFLAKYNSSGNYQWAFKVGNTGGDVARELAFDGSGNLWLTGYFEGTPDFDPSCGTANLTSAGSFDVFVAKYSVSSLANFNSGFETCETVFCYDGVQVPLNSTTTPRTGTNHGQINGGCSGATAGCYDGSIITPLLSFTPGCTYTVKVYARIAVATGNLTIAKSVTSTNASIKAATGADIILASTVVSDFTYKVFTSTFTVSSAESKYIGFQMYRAGGGGTAGAQMMIDDIIITKNNCGHCSNGIQDGGETSVDCGGTDCVSAAPVAGTISPLAQLLACGSGNFSLALCGQTGSIQWQFSQDDATWYDISGENSTVLKGTVTDTTYFRAKVVNDGCSPTPVYSTSYINISGITLNTWLTTGTTAWATATNWSAGVVPTSCHHVTIPSGGVQPAISAAAACNNLTINTGATLTKTGTGGIDIYGDLINNGTFDYSASAAGPSLQGGLNFIGGSGTYVTSTLFIRCITNSNYILSSNLTFGAFDIQTDASLSLQSFTLVCTSDFTQTGNFFANSGTLETQSAGTFTIVNTNWGTGTMFFNRNGAMTLTINDDYYNLKLANTVANTTTIGANITTKNNFIIDNANTTVNGSTFTVTIGGNYTNNGTFTASTSTVAFNGSLAQSITGTSATTFNSLTINNTSSTGVTLNKPATVAGTLTLTDGNLYTSSANSLTLNAGSSVSPAGGSASSFVDGPMLKAGNTAFTFPTGDNGRWRRIGITAPAVVTDAFEAEYLFTGFGSYNIDAAECTANELKEVSATEFWTLGRTAGASTPQVTLHWEDASASNIDDCPDLQIAHRDAINSWWENNHFNTVTVTGSCTGSGAGSIQTNTGVTEFSPFTFGSKTSAAPNSFYYGCPPANLYWVGGNSNWNIAANWSNTSGGPGGAGIPDINTNVFIDNLSGTSTITIPSGTWYTKGFTMSGAGTKSPIIGTGVLLTRP